MYQPKKKSDDHKSTERIVGKAERQTLEDQFQSGKLNLQGDMDPNRYYHIVNDKGGKVDRMKRRGYVVENSNKVWLGDQNPSEVGSIAQTTANESDGTKAIVMSCPREYKDEDDAYRQAQVDKTEESIYRETEKEDRYGKIKKTHRDG